MAVFAQQEIVPGLAVEPVVAAAGLEPVRSVPAVEPVGACRAVDQVVGAAADQPVVAGEAVDVVGQGRARGVKPVVSGRPDQGHGVARRRGRGRVGRRRAAASGGGRGEDGFRGRAGGCGPARWGRGQDRRRIGVGDAAALDRAAADRKRAQRVGPRGVRQVRGRGPGLRHGGLFAVDLGRGRSRLGGLRRRRRGLGCRGLRLGAEVRGLIAQAAAEMDVWQAGVGFLEVRGQALLVERAFLVPVAALGAGPQQCRVKPEDRIRAALRCHVRLPPPL